MMSLSQKFYVHMTGFVIICLDKMISPTFTSICSMYQMFVLLLLSSKFRYEIIFESRLLNFTRMVRHLSRLFIFYSKLQVWSCLVGCFSTYFVCYPIENSWVSLEAFSGTYFLQLFLIYIDEKVFFFTESSSGVSLPFLIESIHKCCATTNLREPWLPFCLTLVVEGFRDDEFIIEILYDYLDKIISRTFTTICSMYQMFVFLLLSSRFRY